MGRRWQPSTSRSPHFDLSLNAEWGQGYQAAVDEQAAEQQERERLAYVAVTRAKHLLVLAWGPAKDQQCNPLFPWLFPEEPLPRPEHDSLQDKSDQTWRQKLQDNITNGRLLLKLLDQDDLTRPLILHCVQVPKQELRLGPVPLRTLQTDWGRSSYTSWSHAASGLAALAIMEQGLDRDGLITSVDPDSWDDNSVDPCSPQQGPLGCFPRGANAGDCLHQILEQIDYGAGGLDGAGEEIVKQELARSGLQNEPLVPLIKGLRQMLATPCGAELGAFHFGSLERSQRLNEMQFDLALGYAKAERLATCFRDHPGGAVSASYADRLATLPIANSGFLTGSIDLIFRAKGIDGVERYWVADWKSNWLGRRDSNNQPLTCGPRYYSQAAMAQVMEANHYLLQGHLYLVALHRFLNWRLRRYKPSQDLGGYVYVFLRGTPGKVAMQMLPGVVPGMVVECPPLGRILALNQALGGLAEAVTA